MQGNGRKRVIATEYYAWTKIDIPGIPGEGLR